MIENTSKLYSLNTRIYSGKAVNNNAPTKAPHKELILPTITIITKIMDSRSVKLVGLTKLIK